MGLYLNSQIVVSHWFGFATSIRNAEKLQKAVAVPESMQDKTSVLESFDPGQCFLDSLGSSNAISIWIRALSEREHGSGKTGPALGNAPVLSPWRLQHLSGPLWLRVQLRSRARLRIAVSITFSFHACLNFERGLRHYSATIARMGLLSGLGRGGWVILPARGCEIGRDRLTVREPPPSPLNQETQTKTQTTENLNRQNSEVL